MQTFPSTTNAREIQPSDFIVKAARVIAKIVAPAAGWRGASNQPGEVSAT